MYRKHLLTMTLVAGALALATAGCTKKANDDNYEGKVKANDPVAMTPGARPRATDKSVVKRPASGKNPRVVLKTSMGNITVELFADKAPISTANYLRYVNAKFYDGTLFHRVMPNFMIQGGGLTPDMQKKPTRPPIKNEAKNGLSNKRGTLAMARTGMPDSATAQFFINVTNNARLDHRGPGRAYGYAVFGRVVGGMDVVDKIRNTPTGMKNGRGNVPVKPVLILQARQQK